MKRVWLLLIETAPDLSVFVFSTKARADAFLSEWCRGRWRAAGLDDAEPISTNDNIAITTYFNRFPKESWSADELTVDPALAEAAA